jgi:hypothetical protein
MRTILVFALLLLAPAAAEARGLRLLLGRGGGGFSLEFGGRSSDHRLAAFYLQGRLQGFVEGLQLSGRLAAPPPSYGGYAPGGFAPAPRPYYPAPGGFGLGGSPYGFGGLPRGGVCGPFGCR